MASRYLAPTAVISPKRHWALIAVLQDEGAGEHSLALGRWKNQPVLAIRWNGKEEENSIGTPQSRGLPTWFILPDTYREAILSTLPLDKLMLARNFFPRRARQAFAHHEFPCYKCGTKLMVHVQEEGEDATQHVSHVRCLNPKCQAEQSQDFGGKVVLVAYKADDHWISIAGT